MSAFRPFRRADYGFIPATVATLATVSAAAVAWRDALFALSPDRDPCPGFRPGAWARVWSNALDFIDRHGTEAHRLGWTAEELFGVHPALGVIRVDRTGALMLSSAGGCSQSRPI